MQPVLKAFTGIGIGDNSTHFCRIKLFKVTKMEPVLRAACIDIGIGDNSTNFRRIKLFKITKMLPVRGMYWY